MAENSHHYFNVRTLFFKFLKLFIILGIVKKPDQDRDPGPEEKWAP